MNSDAQAAIAEFLATIVPHIRRLEAVKTLLIGDAREAVERCIEAELNALLAIQRERHRREVSA